ncbi:MAG: hypothetical protein KDE58_35200, partial [Caldilineaceae bacterium]|nr:hypothetical protein [Caldilineaceae bacterium]
QLVAYHTTRGDHGNALPFAQRWLALEPLDVEALQAVLHLFAATGEPTTALHHYQTFRQMYQQEHGELLENRELEALVHAITAGQYQSQVRVAIVNMEEPGPVSQIQHKADQQTVSYLSPGSLVAIYGRATQLKRITDRLQNSNERLITLVGMGGVGKTVLAQAIGQRLQTAFSAGVCFVALADLAVGSEMTATEQQVALAIAAALGITVRDDNEIQVALERHLHRLELLLILDNVEQLVEIAPFFRQLLQRAPQLRLLVTSRLRLNLAEERVETVATLPLPPTPPILTTMAENPAVQLFVARAEQQLSTFVLDATNMAAIHRICHTVGGLPLALEIAAYWITLYTPQEIAESIAQEAGFLTRQTNDGSARQRSMAEIFEYSWQLLSPAAQETLAALTIFQNSFTRTAALAVTACTVHDLSTLIHCALLEVKSPGVYALHPLIKSFAAARGQVSRAVEARYTTHLLGQLLPSGSAPSASTPQPPMLAHSTHDAADLAHAWELAVAQQDAAYLIQVLPHFSHYWRVIGRPRAGIRLLRHLQARLETKEPPTAVEARLLGCTLHQTLRLAHILLADHATARADGERAVAYLSQFGVPLELGHLLLDLGNLYVDLARATEAEALLQQALTIAKREGALRLQIGVTVILSRIAWARGDWQMAEFYCQDALAVLPTAVEPPPETTDLLWEMFNQALLRHDLTAAEAIYQRTCAFGNGQATDINQQLQQREMALSLAFSQERWDDAHALAQTHLAAMAEQENRRAYGLALTALAMTTLHVDNAANAVGFAEEALAVATAEALTAELPHMRLTLGVINAALDKVGEARRHFVMVLEDALARPGELYSLRHLLGALFHLAKLERPKLPPALFAQIVATVAAQPQSATLTRTEAARLAEREEIDLATAKERASHAVDWAVLTGLARRVLWQLPITVESTVETIDYATAPTRPPLVLVDQPTTAVATTPWPPQSLTPDFPNPWSQLDRTKCHRFHL